MAKQQTEAVGLGTWVRLTGFEGEEHEVFRIVPEGRADYLKNEIPPSNPLAKALKGARVGDRVSFPVLGNKVELTILEVGQL